MRPSEELMVLLELNNYSVDKFKLKKQVEYEETGNLDLYKYKKYSELVVCHYLYEGNLDYFSRNPLTYRFDWGEDVKSMDQFNITHPDIEEKMTLKEFLGLERFNEVNKESVLYDVLDGWVEEYREASIKSMENLRDMIVLLPKKNKKYHKPSKLVFLLSALFALFNMLLFKNPETLQPSFMSFISDFVIDWNQLLYDVPLYSLYGVFTILLFVLYAVLNNSFSRLIRDVRGEKNKYAVKTFDKWDNDMKNARLKQSGILEDYVDLVVKKPKKSKLELKTLIGPEILMDKFKNYVKMVEKKYDWMTKNYSRFMTYIRLLFLLAFLFNLGFIGVGFAIMRGLINV